MLSSFRVPTPAPRGCGRAPIVNSVPAGGARLRGGGGVVAPTGRPEAIHGTFYDLLVAGTVFKVFKDVGQRGGDTAPFGQVVALATPWRRGRRHKGSEAKLENFENRGGPIFLQFPKILPRPRGRGRHFGKLRKRGPPPGSTFFKILPSAPWGCRPDSRCEVSPVCKGPDICSTHRDGPYGVPDRREAVSLGLPGRGGVGGRIMKRFCVATPKRRQASKIKNGRSKARSQP